jgi:hypothetical protein
MMRWLSAINLVGLVAVVVLAVALRYPWWTFDTDLTPPTTVYAYRIRGSAIDIIGYSQSRQMRILTIVLVGCVLLALVGSVVRGRPGRAGLAAAGLFTLYGAYRLMGRIAEVADRWEIPIQGQGTAQDDFGVLTAVSRLEPGVYLTVAGGVLCLLAAVLHNRARLRSS